MDGETVKIELTPEGRLRLEYQLCEAMMKKEHPSSASFKVLDLGFELNKNWPLEGEILLSQLVMLARKLEMSITIGDINLSPMKSEVTENSVKG